MKVEEWDIKAKAINVGALLLWFLIMTALVYKVKGEFALIYIVFTLFVVVMDRFFRCTRCYYHGSSCYCFGGKLSALIFRSRENSKEKTEDYLSALLLILFILFPILVFLVFGSVGGLAWPTRIGFSIMQLCLAGGWFFQHSRTACPVCKNTVCPFYQAE